MQSKDLHEFIDEIKTVLILEHRMHDSLKLIRKQKRNKFLRSIQNQEQQIITSLHKLVAESGKIHEIR